MDCPACRTSLVAVEFSGIELDVCVSCRGSWFDAEEIDLLLSVSGLAAPELWEKLRAQEGQPEHERRRCPRCRRDLETVVLPSSEGKVHLDRCARGDGLWFDRGELSALPSLPGENVPEAVERIKNYLGRYAQP